MMKITSTANPKIKRAVKLKHRKTREETGLTVIDGFREVSRAREAGIVFEELYVCPGLLEKFGGKPAVDTVASWGIETCEVSVPVFKKICFGERKEGIVAVARAKEFLLDAAVLPKNPVVVVLDNVEKPGNLGAILRSCDGAGVNAVIVAGTGADILNPNVIRASTGTVFSMNVMQAPALQVRDFLKDNQIAIIAAVPKGQQAYFLADLRGPVAFILGAEDTGLSDFWIESADVRISIPMRGRADSLNVSHAAAVLVYETLRQR